MYPNVVSLPAASSSEHLLALAEVDDFGSTDMGYPGEGPWTFRILREPSLTAELTRAASPQSNRKVDSLTFQPCSPHIYQNQDRFIVEEWNLLGGTWQFNSVFDGHVNHHTVDYVAETLPRQLKKYLSAALRELGNQQIHPAHFSNLFPEDPRRLSRMSDGQVQDIFSRDASGQSRRAAARCLGGTTLLISLTDPGEENVWIANLGGTLVNQLHATYDQREAQRIRSEHPQERTVLEKRKILGFLEPTQSDWRHLVENTVIVYLPRFLNLEQDWISPGTLKQCAARISTPPYVSNIPDIYHRDLPNRPWFLLLCSDGLPATEVYNNLDIFSTIRLWTELVGNALDSSSPPVNLALSLLRAAIGGANERTVSRNLTVEMEERWMDDVSISIQRFTARRPPSVR
ncbi:PPM-type phosphatase domain-containing protein [Favolaschia claudopus]|uniref:PPM-type phosphatase domain-containing protein n=1 Tax=Favolaschia claudopus TaxID=2862362 RepID=A0AAW0E2N2_9AGAR